MAEDEEESPLPNSDKETSEQPLVSSTTVESSEFVVSGPGANITINKASYQDFMELHKFAYKQGYDAAFQGKGWKRDLEEDLLCKMEQKGIEDTETTNTQGNGAEQLETLDDIASWYENLPNTYTQYLVQTVASLHGAPAADIARLVKILDASGTQEQRMQLGNDSSSEKSRRPLSDRELYRYAHIERSRINGIARLFWKNLDNSGQQRFTTLVLRYLAEETLLSSGPDLIDILKGWIEQGSNDCAWRAARALGIILFWRSSTQELWRLANEWGNSTRMRDWRNAASLLSGAYNVEWIEDKKRASNPKQSDILRLLNQWVERSQKPAGWRVGCAAAETYDLLDKYNPDIALNGLEKLLRLPGSGVSNSWESISMRLFTACISNYVSIAWSNRVRNMLERLAHHARTLVYQEHRPEQIDDDLRYQGQCELHLEAVLTIFFLIVVFAFVDDHTGANYNLTEPLAAQPRLPDDQGRDILLAGILSSPEHQWRKTITSLLCTAFFAQKEEQALSVMRQWADTIEAVTQTDMAKQQQAQALYRHFIVRLHDTIEEWETDPQRNGIGPISASKTFRYHLRSWTEKADWNGTVNSVFIRTFTQSILTQLEG